MSDQAGKDETARAIPFREWLRVNCADMVDWSRNRSAEQTYAECQRSDWLLSLCWRLGFRTECAEFAFACADRAVRMRVAEMDSAGMTPEADALRRLLPTKDGELAEDNGQFKHAVDREDTTIDVKHKQILSILDAIRQDKNDEGYTCEVVSAAQFIGVEATGHLRFFPTCPYNVAKCMIWLTAKAEARRVVPESMDGSESAGDLYGAAYVNAVTAEHAKMCSQIRELVPWERVETAMRKCGIQT